MSLRNKKLNKSANNYAKNTTGIELPNQKLTKSTKNDAETLQAEQEMRWNGKWRSKERNERQRMVLRNEKLNKSTNNDAKTLYE